MFPERFTYPFCYTPHPLVKEAAEELCRRIKSDESLDYLFSEGKMMGVLMVETSAGDTDFLYGFSGSVKGNSIIDGFVPPIFDLLNPDGYYRKKEAEIVAEPDPSKKKAMSKDLQDWIFRQYIVSNARGEKMSISDIFASDGLVPPGGTGDCAAPKMLQYAYDNGLRPLAMGEFWYGASPAGEIRRHGCFYPSCTGKCGPLLEFMLQGLEIEDNPLEKGLELQMDSSAGLLVDGSQHAGLVIYEDDTIIVADKPCGMLSVPGRSSGVRSLLETLSDASGCEVFSCHRLDMDTSGLIVYAKTRDAKIALEKQFSGRDVKKTYLALLTPGVEEFNGPKKGLIDLPIGFDWYDRPRQMVDRMNGKPSRTEYEILGLCEDGRMLVRFTPLTGRTHQLRVHSAHQDGLGRPICGDRLYGGGTGIPLQLVAHTLSFTHPVTHERMEFKSSLAVFEK